MYVTTRNFMQFLVEYTKSLNTTIVLLRTIGPDNASDAEKANAIYSAYYMNMQSENPKIFDTMLYNEFTFVGSFVEITSHLIELLMMITLFSM
jgi:hypothetical protein